MIFTFPPPLAPGDLVAVVAPSSPFPAAELWTGLAWLRTRYRISLHRGAFAKDGYLAGSDARRAAELGAAMRDPEVKAIVAARGGYGSMRIVDALPWEAFVRAPKWIAGFSDVTGLAVEAWRRGVACVHGPNVTGLGFARATAWTRYRFTAALERPRAGVEWRGLSVLREGEAEGPIVGGNLALVAAMAAARADVVPEGAILALEDVGERPYRVDRMLTALRLGGHLARAAGIVLGGFTRCEPGADGRCVEDVLADLASALSIPVYAGAPFGHDDGNEAFVLGARARMSGGTVVTSG